MSVRESEGEKRIAALVPMRHCSERVPGKNYRSFAGKPLYSWVIECLLEVGSIDQIVINTDSPEIMRGVAEQFPEVRLLERPKSLRGGEVPMNDVLMHDVRHVEADFYLQTHSTNPLLRPQTVREAIDLFLEAYPSYDSLFSVTPIQTRFWDELARPVNHNQNVLLRTQDLPPLYEENSCIYIFTADILQERRNRIGQRPLMHEIQAQEAIDIDDEIDFRIAELLCRERCGI